MVVTSVLSVDITAESLGGQILKKYLSFVEQQRPSCNSQSDELELTRPNLPYYHAMSEKGWQLYLTDKKTRYSMGK